MAAALDRGQAYNPTSGAYYAERMAVARELLDELLQRPSKNITMEDLDGEWELVFSTVKHGIFRSSPFFSGRARGLWWSRKFGAVLQAPRAAGVRYGDCVCW